jgi:hypothetical protein
VTETYIIDAQGRPVITKDPDEVLDYPFEWSAYLLPTTDTITSASFEALGVVVDSTANTTTTATAIVSGGVVGVSASVTCTINTAQGRIVQRSIFLKIKER